MSMKAVAVLLGAILGGPIGEPRVAAGLAPGVTPPAGAVEGFTPAARHVEDGYAATLDALSDATRAFEGDQSNR
jgi:hypothetical protein